MRTNPESKPSGQLITVPMESPTRVFVACAGVVTIRNPFAGTDGDPSGCFAAQFLMRGQR